MQFFSQHDPSYDRQTLGKTSLIIHGYGCFLCSIATLYQVPPLTLAKVGGAFNGDGLLFPEVLATACSGRYSNEGQNPPAGWCIGVTDHYKDLGYPTHFFCVNPVTQEQIDPLNFPAIIGPLKYPIIEYRKFTNIKLDTNPIPAKDMGILTRALKFAQGARKVLIERIIKRLQKRQ